MRFTPVLAAALFIAGTSCGQQNTEHENLDAQYNADSQAEYDKLKPAEAVWTGKMHLIESNQDFDATLTLQRTPDNSHVAGSPDPTSTTELPTLKGNLHFAVLDADDDNESDLSNLLDPMGLCKVVMFEFGNYIDKTQQLILPYSVPNYTLGNFGNLTGKLDGDHYQGTWFANPFGNVGTFDFVKAASQ